MVSELALAIAVLVQPTTMAALLKGIDSVAVSQKFSGVIMVGETDGDMDFAPSYGMSNRVDTKFATGSVAQTFTAVAVCMLMQDGKIALNAPLSRYLPDRGDRTTIRQLLTHTAGLGPGADYDLLGAVIEHVSGQPFPDVVRDRVFTWAGMTNSSIAYTNARDLYLFAGMLLRRPLPGLFTDTVTTGQEGPNHAYGYGFFVGKVGGKRIVNQGDMGPGIENAFDIYPDLDLFVIILSDQDPPAAQHIRQYLRDGIASPSFTGN